MANVQRLPGAPVEIDLGRGSAAVLWKSVPLGLLASGGCVYAALDAKDTATRVVGFCFAAFFAVPPLVALLNLQKLLAPRGLVIDARGVRYWRADLRVDLPWEVVAAIGIGYDAPPEFRKLSQRLADAIVDPRRNFAVEIFPVDPRATEQWTELRPFRREGNPPAPGLPRQRWRVPVPPPGKLGERVEAGVKEFRREKWAGWYARA